MKYATIGIDDDGDGLEDCADPDCGLITNREFDESSTGWQLYAAIRQCCYFTPLIKQINYQA